MAEAGPSFWMTKRALEVAAVDPLAVAVYAGLCRLQNDAGSIWFSASDAQVAKAAGCGSRSAAKFVRLLIQLRLVGFRTGRHAGENGEHLRNQYMISDTARHGDGLPRDVRKPPAYDGDGLPRAIPESNADNKERGLQTPFKEPGALPHPCGGGAEAPDNDAWL